MLAIENKQIGNLLKKLSARYEIKNAQSDILTFKKHFLPPAQKMFQKSNSSKEIKTSKPPRKFVLYGLNSTDLSALTYLDEIMSFPEKDFFYFQNRKQAIIIGLIHENFDAPSGGDLIFQKIGENDYKVLINSKSGKKIIEKYSDFFTEKEAAKENSVSLKSNIVETTNLSSNSEWQKEMQNLLKDPEILKDAVQSSRDSKIWDGLAEICLGCGICSYVCPLCYCFSLEDSVDLNGSCSRCRKWTSCVLPEFSRISGGHSFRPNLKERYYNWFYHKFVRGYLEYGKSQCVGCERCKKYCPAKIDILEVLKRILEEYKKTI